MTGLDGWMWLVLLGLTAISVITRSFFFISERPWRLPGWAQRGLQYAPIAALAAVIAPDILTPGGQWVAPWSSAHIWGALVAAGFYFWQRQGRFVLPLSIAVGMAVYLPLRLWVS